MYIIIYYKYRKNELILLTVFKVIIFKTEILIGL